MNKEKNNILIIYTDQHRYDCLGAYGNEEIKTPNIDRIAGDGVLYNNCFCSYPVCTPSRYSFISGLYVHQHLASSNRSTLPEGINTFPKILRENGYNTKAVGKMHYTPTYLDVGFEEMILSEQDGPGRLDDDYHRYLKEKSLVDKIDLIDQVKDYRDQAPDEYWNKLGAIESNLIEEDYSTSWIGERAIETIKDWRGNNNLLMVGFIKPHHPFDPPAPWSEMYNPDELSILPGWTENCLDRDLIKNEGYFPHEEINENKLRLVMAMYYASISQIDAYIGKMVDILKKKGIYDNTLIIFSSDHGEYLGFHHLLLKNNYMYDPVVKVPLIIKYPQKKDKAITYNGLVSNIDIAPTILEVCGIRKDRLMNGINLFLEDNKRKYIFSESDFGNQYMVRSNKYKLILCKNKESQFYDLEKDPYEIINLYNDSNYQDEVNLFKEELFRWLLFEDNSLKIRHKNENAQLISGPNVLNSDKSHREEIENYFKCIIN